MKRILNIVVGLIIGFAVFQVFIKNKAEANPKESYDLLTRGKGIFLDVREKSEVEDGIIKGAHWFPLSKIESNKMDALQEIKKISEGKQVFVYCRSGARSGRVKSFLQEVQVNAVNLGGYSSLISEGLPIEKK